ncbi:hypothetical protein SADUNF_Sadunf16G0292200 [Salix dunnii]|uniref:GIR1-like zinc ribbon domain-containing protein n=1 Tax=Salix dunnii TaxID=1413687 RepID=A0A835JCW2_9ROSI|nr:hypothetical protein SADUNF_Sadunf16G0292200 [Salix dunnii]
MVNSSGNSEILITKDLLGGFSKVSNKDLDLDLPSTGKVCSQRCNSVSSPSPCLYNTKHHKQRTTQESEVQDSKFPPLKFPEESCLGLKLVPSSHYESVKSALQRAEKETMTKKRSPPPTPPTSDIKEEEISTRFSSTGVFAVACPGCLHYVITMKTNPKCPSCHFTVPSPLVKKKPRTDLNASL